MHIYNAYKDSGIKWIGEIPEHWEVKRLASCFTENKKTNSDLSVIEAYKFYYGTLVRKDVGIDVKDVKDTYSKYTVLRPNDIVINGLNLNYDFVSQRVAISNNRGIITSAYLAITPRKNVSPQYYCYLLKTMDCHKLFHGMGTGIRLTLSYGELKKQPIVIPPLSEQEAIVDFIDRKASKIDAYIADKERELQLLGELKQTEIANVVTKGLNPNAPMKDSGIPWIGIIPEHWEVKRLASCFTENKKTNSNLSVIEAYKFYYGTLVRKDEGIDVKEVKDTYSKYTVLEPNDIVINGLNLNYDFVSQRVAISNNRGIITSAYLAITPKKSVSPQYYCYLLKTMDSCKLFHGMGTGIRLTLSYDELKKQSIIIPPHSEQEAIAEQIKTRISEIESLVADLQQQIAYLKELKQRLIADAVTGKINVTEK